MPLTAPTWWLGRAVGALTVAALAGFALAFFRGTAVPGRRALVSYSRGLDEQLAFLRSKVGGPRIVVAQSVAGSACLVAALFGGTWLAAIPVPVIATAPRLVLHVLAARRTRKLEEQIEPWLNAIANALKASPSLGEALSSSLSLLQPPMSEEIDVALKEYALGTPLDRALANMGERIDSRTFRGSILALKVARRSGGNLPEMLQSAAAALREMARLEGVVRTKTAEGKAQAFVIGVLPLPLVCGVRLMDAHFFDPLVSSFLGQLIIGGAVVLWVLAILSARKILAVDI